MAQKNGPGRRGRVQVARLRARDGDHCCFCGYLMHFRDANGKSDGKHSLTASLEHVIGQADGGSNSDENMKLAHSLCNSAANELSLEQKSKMYSENLAFDIIPTTNALRDLWDEFNMNLRGK